MRSRVKSKKKSKSPKRRSPKSISKKRSVSPKRKSPKGVRTKSKCKDLLQKKIKKNMKEYKQGRYVSRQQALAVSYSQVKKASPYCNRYFKRSSKK